MSEPAGQMENRAAPSASVAEKPHWGKRLLHCVRLTLQLLGTLASLFFIFLGIWQFINPHFHGFWEFSRWLAEALLYVIGGLAGCALEGLSCVATGHFARFAKNRMSAVFFYAWVGLYMMGADAEGLAWLETLMRTVGIVSWVVAIGDFAVSCTSGNPWNNPHAVGASPKCAGAPGAPGAAGAPATADAGGPQDEEQGRVSPAAAPIEVPTGGWNNGGGNPFAGR